MTEIGVSFVKYDPRPGARYPILRQALHYIPLEWRHLVNGRCVEIARSRLTSQTRPSSVDASLRR